MYWNWLKGGIILGLSFLLAVAVIKPIGVSTQFVILDGVLAKQFNNELIVKDETAKTGYASSNAYLNKSGGKYAKEVANPINYGFLFVVFMFLGGFLGKKMQKGAQIKQLPVFHLNRFGDKHSTRYLLAFLGGAIVLWGARLAGGCTSGHMMSGMMQTSISGYLFAIAAFIVAIPTSIYIYKN
ncbi:MAG: YeeE/YedE family protein [Bdellovibrionales bacterium]|nr:YeeE/YedE family protein [Bdellovibrionales bacterium]